MSLFSFFKGEKGEKEVLDILKKQLDKKSENYYLVPHVALKDITATKDIDILLVHPVLGIFIIEVKNWNSLEKLKEYNPFKQANRYQDIMLSLINDKIGNVINIDYKVVFPEISRHEAQEFFENNGYSGYLNNAVFKEDLQNLESFFRATNDKIPTKEEFLKITSLLIPRSERKNIMPVITKDEVLFFDYKQLSVLNGYTGGLRVIRGVAGTGKTIILTNFVKNIIKNENKKFLILCFNKKLAKVLKKELKNKNIKVLSLFELINKLGFNFEGKKAGKCPKCGNELIVRNGKYGEFIACISYPECRYNQKLTIDKKYEILENELSLKELDKKFKEFQKNENFDYFISDETQDFPAGFTRIIINNINNSILFIDEAQKIYPYTMDSIRDVLWHKSLGVYKNVTKENFRNLYNVYRTPNNIAKCAFEILSNDNKIDSYYKNIKFIKEDFVKDINFVLEEGEFVVDDFNELDELQEVVNKIKGDKIILSFKNDDVKEIERKLQIDAMPMSAVKGLEADNIIIHNFEEFLNVASKSDIFFRQIYVLLTRSKKNIFISINEEELVSNPKTQKVIEILKKYSNSTIEEIADSKTASKTPSLMEKIDKEKIEKTTSILVAGAEIFAAFAGLFNL